MLRLGAQKVLFSGIPALGLRINKVKDLQSVTGDVHRVVRECFPREINICLSLGPYLSLSGVFEEKSVMLCKMNDVLSSD